jgi:hypothetical protein
MIEKVSKTNENLLFFDRHLDAIRMSDHERWMAKARFAQAEAVADALFAAARAINRLFKRLPAKAVHPAAPSARSAG